MTKKKTTPARAQAKAEWSLAILPPTHVPFLQPVHEGKEEAQSRFKTDSSRTFSNASRPVASSFSSTRVGPILSPASLTLRKKQVQFNCYSKTHPPRMVPNAVSQYNRAMHSCSGQIWKNLRNPEVAEAACFLETDQCGFITSNGKTNPRCEIGMVVIPGRRAAVETGNA